MIAKVSGYTKNLGIAMMMEHPIPGKGGRHRQTLSYGQSPDLKISPRKTLAREIRDLRLIYQKQRIYTEKIRFSLQEIIKMNKLSWVGVFEK